MIKFLTENKFKNAIITASSAAAGYPANNLINDFPKKKWRANSDSDEWVKFDLQQAEDVSMVSIILNNLTSGATLRLYGHASDLGNTAAAWSGATYQDDVEFDSNLGVLFFDQTLRWWFLEVDDSSNPDGYVELGLFYGGESISPGENFNENFQEIFMDNSSLSFSDGHHGYSVRKSTWKDFQIQFRDISYTNKGIVQDIWNAVGRNLPIVIALDPDGLSLDLTRYGKFTNESLDFEHQAFERVSCSFSFSEMR